MYVGVGREWAVDAALKARCKSNPARAGLGWILRIAMKDLVLADVVG